jgi:uncharacterized protein YdcH (DUF465 family)
MEKHALLTEFPEYHDQILSMKLENEHFKKLYEAYDALDHHVYRIESGNEVTTDEHLNELKLKRVHLKDELFAMLQ